MEGVSMSRSLEDNEVTGSDMAPKEVSERVS